MCNLSEAQMEPPCCNMQLMHVHIMQIWALLTVVLLYSAQAHEQRENESDGPNDD